MEFPYDLRHDPPAPVLPVRIGVPGGNPGVLLSALVDTGADATVIPEGIATQLGLPPVDQVRVRGVGPMLVPAIVYAAEVEVIGVRRVMTVLGLGNEALLGRDLLNDWTAILRGPRRTMEVLREG